MPPRLPYHDTAGRPALTAYLSNLWPDPDSNAARPRWIRLGVYATHAALQDAARAYDRARRVVDDWDGVAGAFQPSVFSERYDRKTRRWVDSSGSFAGVLRLSQQELTPAVIAHEATHAALHLRRLHTWAMTHPTDHVDGGDTGVGLSDGFDAIEEVLAYLVGDITSAITAIITGHRLMPAA